MRAEPVERAADAAARRLLDVLAAPGGPDETVARITVLVQGCDATANLVARRAEPAARAARRRPGGSRCWPRPPTAGHRCPRSAASPEAPARLGERAIAEGDTVVCDIDKASGTRTAAGERSAAADPDGAASALTFGYGLRPARPPEQALALAAGVIDAVRGRGQ